MQFDFPVYSRISKRAKKISAYVRMDGIEVVLPQFVDFKQATPLLVEHADWFKSKWLGLQQKKQQSLLSSSVWPLTLNLGSANLRLSINLTVKRQFYYLIISSTPNNLNEINLGRILTAEKVVTNIKQWLKDYTTNYFQPLLEQTAANMGCNFTKFNVNFAKSCWGSCHSNKTITLNALLLFFEPKYLDYVIVHECAHLTYMNHSRRFWQLVAEYCPNYAMIKKELAVKSADIPPWLFDATLLSLPNIIPKEETKAEDIE